MVLTGDLRHRDFAGQDLQGAVFERADLYRARFDGANLAEATFAGCFAAEATLERTNCRALLAAGSNFYRANFRSADLTDALLWNCVLAGADLRGATLKHLTLTLDCNSFEEIRLSRTASAKLAYLFGRARSPHQPRWLDVIGEHDLVWLDRLFTR